MFDRDRKWSRGTHLLGKCLCFKVLRRWVVVSVDVRHVDETGSPDVLAGPGYFVGQGRVTVFETVVQSRSVWSWEYYQESEPGLKERFIITVNQCVDKQF